MNNGKRILIPKTKEDIQHFKKDVNFGMEGGKAFSLSGKEFEILWRSGILNRFYNKTGILIDEFETTIIDDMEQLSFLVEVISKCRLPPSSANEVRVNKELIC
jgi:hypothetical protein